MKRSVQLVIFRIDEQRYALPLEIVERIVRAVEFVPLPGGPAIVLGVVDVGGRILPLFNTRERFGLKTREIAPSDQFLIANLPSRSVVLLIDEAEGIIADPNIKPIDTRQTSYASRYIDGATRLEDNLVLIHDLKRFLSLEEMGRLEQAMSQKEAHGN